MKLYVYSAGKELDFNWKARNAIPAEKLRELDTLFNELPSYYTRHCAAIVRHNGKVYLLMRNIYITPTMRDRYDRPIYLCVCVEDIDEQQARSIISAYADDEPDADYHCFPAISRYYYQINEASTTGDKDEIGNFDMNWDALESSIADVIAANSVQSNPSKSVTDESFSDWGLFVSNIRHYALPEREGVLLKIAQMAPEKSLTLLLKGTGEKPIVASGTSYIPYIITAIAILMLFIVCYFVINLISDEDDDVVSQKWPSISTEQVGSQSPSDTQEEPKSIDSLPPKQALPGEDSSQEPYTESDDDVVSQKLPSISTEQVGSQSPSDTQEEPKSIDSLPPKQALPGEDSSQEPYTESFGESPQDEDETHFTDEIF